METTLSKILYLFDSIYIEISCENITDLDDIENMAIKEEFENKIRFICYEIGIITGRLLSIKDSIEFIKIKQNIKRIDIEKEKS